VYTFDSIELIQRVILRPRAQADADKVLEKLALLSTPCAYTHRDPLLETWPRYRHSYGSVLGKLVEISKTFPHTRYVTLYIYTEITQRMYCLLE